MKAAMCEGGWDYFVPDHSWVGVMRMAPVCQGNGSADGLSIGPGPNLKWTPGYDEFNITARAIKLGLLPAGTRGNTAKVGYGCWFYMSGEATKWTSTKVNVGRSLRAAGHCSLNAALYGTTLRAHLHDGLCTDHPGDKMWCLFARRLGYGGMMFPCESAYSGYEVQGTAGSPGKEGPKKWLTGKPKLSVTARKTNMQ